MTSVTESIDTGNTKKPADSAFKQQKLPAWQPILTAGTVLPTFFVIGIAFIPVGIGLLYFSDEVKEHIIDYTNCNETILEPSTSTNNYSWRTTNRPCIDIIKNDTNAVCHCRIEFQIESFEGNVFMYYGLSNFYQNHRRYVKSRDDSQLLGNLKNNPAYDCAPFDYVTENNQKIPIAPCGAIANSMFNDVLSLSMAIDSQWHNVTLLNTGIAWDSDKNIKFRNPPGDDLEKAFAGYTRPKAWKRDIWDLDSTNKDNNGFQNEDLIVWMRTAALPTFRKLYRRIDHSKPYFGNGLQKGQYLLIVEYNYDVSTFDGTKQMILSTTSLLGGKNPFLGIAYIVVGVLCLVLGIALLLIHIKCGRSTSEMINVNPRTPYQ